MTKQPCYHGSRFKIEVGDSLRISKNYERPHGVYYTTHKPFALMYAFSDDRKSSPDRCFNPSDSDFSLSLLSVHNKKAYQRERKQYDYKGYLYTIAPESIAPAEQGARQNNSHFLYPTHYVNKRQTILTREEVTFEQAKEQGLQIFYPGPKAPKPKRSLRNPFRKPTMSYMQSLIENTETLPEDQQLAWIEQQCQNGILEREGNDALWQQALSIEKEQATSKPPPTPLGELSPDPTPTVPTHSKSMVLSV